MRTEDMNRFENLARSLSYDEELDEAEVADVLAATRRTREELERRAAYHKKRREPPPPPSELEQYQAETKVLGMDEGLAIIALPLVFMAMLFGCVILAAIAAL